jgi:hypothetical protein
MRCCTPRGQKGGELDDRVDRDAGGVLEVPHRVAHHRRVVERGALGLELDLHQLLRVVQGEPPPSSAGAASGRCRFLSRADIFLRPFSPDSADALKPFFVAARTYTLPKTLDEFLKRIVTPGLERWLGGGAVGVDVAIAEYRPSTSTT